MNWLLDKLSRLVTSRPWVVLAALLVVTVILAAGMSLRAPLVDTEGFFPPDSPILEAMEEIDEQFPASGQVSTTTLVFRGQVLTPAGLTQMDSLIGRISGEPEVEALLLGTDAIVSPALLIRTALGTDRLGSVSQEQIDQASAAPEIRDALNSLTGVDAVGTQIAVATFRLRDTSDEQIQDAERLIHDLASNDAGVLEVSSLSSTLIEDAYQASRDQIGPLIGAALIVIAVLVMLFLRSISDLLLTVGGLLISVIWVLGVEGWLGPRGLGLTGPPNGITIMIPIIVISLGVDYAIQAVSHYREQRMVEASALEAVRSGLRHVLVPLTLAAVTTVVSFLAAVISPIPAVDDFGIVSGFGVGMSLIVMLTLIPASRVILDRRREAKGALGPPRLVAEALPGLGRVAEALGRSVTHRPAPYVIAIVALTIGLAVAATGIESRFSIRDILAQDQSVVQDLDTVEQAVGGSTQLVNVLIQAEATETTTLLNLRDLRLAFEDERRRPLAAVGPIENSYEPLVFDWIDDSGEPGDRYDARLAMLFDEASNQLGIDPGQMQAFLDELERADPMVAGHLVNDPLGIDTILLQFPAQSLDHDRTKRIQDEIEAIWRGDDEAITAASESIVSVAITDEITSRQTQSISTTIVVALLILVAFFWMTLRQPVLAVIAVAPIALALLWVLGTMALLNIPYTLVTSMITALSVGIGVDYTIHVIHRYREEFSRLRNPEQAAIRTLAMTGSALLGSALTTALGLGVLVLSPVEATQEFGITAAFAIVYALVVSTVLVPPMMTIWGAYQNMRLRSSLERLWQELDEAIDDMQKRHEGESTPS